MSLPRCVAALRAAYPRADFPEDTIRLYAAMLSDLDPMSLLAATNRLIRKSTFLPSIAEIRREVAEEALALPSPEAAWEILLTGSLREAPPELQAAARACGGRYAVMQSENPAVIRSQFTRDYTARREQALLVEAGARLPNAQLPPAVADRSIIEGDAARLDDADVRMTLRPTMHRLLWRLSGRTLGPPSEEEKQDAIEVLRRGTMLDDPSDDALYAEAERVLDEAGR